MGSLFQRVSVLWGGGLFVGRSWNGYEMHRVVMSLVVYGELFIAWRRGRVSQTPPSRVATLVRTESPKIVGFDDVGSYLWPTSLGGFLVEASTSPFLHFARIVG